MSIQSQLDRLASALTCLRPQDPQSRSDLAETCRDVFQAVKGGPLADPLSQALEAAQRVALDIEQDPSGDLALIESVVEWALEAVAALEHGERVEPFGSPEKEAEEQVDSELLGMFLASALDSLSTIEEYLLALEEDPDQPECVTQVRGVVHSLKGECGVIPLPTAQALLHLSETALDQVLASGKGLPADVFFCLLDWMKAYIHELEQDPDCDPPEYTYLQENIAALAEGRELPHPKTCSKEEAAPPPSAAASSSASSAINPSERVQFPEEVLSDPTLAEFLAEARGHLEDSEAALLEIESDPEDIEIIDRIFRAFHTIKGVAGFMNMEDMVKLAHASEALLDEFRKGNLICTTEHTSLIFAACDAMNSMLDYLCGEEPPLRLSIYELIEALELAAQGEESAALTAQPTPPKPHTPASPGTPDEGSTPLLGQYLLERNLITDEALQQALQVQRHLQKTGSSKRLGEILAEAELISIDSLKAALLGQRGASIAGAQTFPFAEAVIESGLLSETEVKQTLRSTESPKAQRKRKPHIEQTVKVATRRLDVLIDMVGELVIAQQMLTQDPELEEIRSQRLQRNLTQVGKITRDLQEAAMSLRMVTLRSTFQKMSRLVRDVSSKAGKLVAFTVTGEETELDRNVVEEISDPLVHLIRNAIDHGLETPEERVERNKDPKGNIALNAYHQGGSIVIEIRDDGNGMDRERILAKALERGLIDGNPDDMPDSEVYKLIFQPGFSTAEKVTDISGRGVGMDVVRRNIEAMRGRIDIESHPGEGSTFYLRLPLTLAIIDGMIVRVGSHRYVIPTLTIEQSFRPDENSTHRVLHDGEMVEVRGKLIPIHRLRDIFDLNEGLEEISEGILVLVEGAGERACVFVDEILGQQQVVIKNLGKALPPTQGISGGAILGDGRVALILDTDALLTSVAATPVP